MRILPADKSAERTKPKRRRFSLRFSLRSFLFVNTVVVIGLALFIQSVKDQMSAVKAIESNCGSVDYDYQHARWPNGLAELAKSTSIVALSLAHSTGSITNAGAISLAIMKQLKALDLDGSQVTKVGLQSLAENKNIKVPNLGGTLVAWEDADQLKKTSRPDITFEE